MRLLLTSAFLLSACGSAPSDVEPEPEPVGVQSQAAVTYIMAWNSFTSLPNLQTHICHPVSIQGQGANSQSHILPGSVPACGGTMGIGPTSVTAYPNACVVPIHDQQGSMSTLIRCQPKSDFGAVTFADAEAFHMWNYTHGVLEPVSAGVQMSQLVPSFNSYNACFLSGLGHMSVGNEYAWITYSGTHAWLNAQGYKGLSARGRCVRLGRAGGPVATVHAWPGTPGTGISVASGVCFLTQVNGAVDNGGVILGETGGTWSLAVNGSVGYARAECYTYL
jgi:hypothetical protein